MTANEALKHGDPRHHSEDIAKLKIRIRQLEAEKKDLEDALIAATHNSWRARGW